MLAGGEWDKLGLTDSEAEEAWYRFGDLMSGHYGETGREILNYAHPLHSGTGERIRKESEGKPEDRPSSGLESGKGPRYRFAVKQVSFAKSAPSPTARTPVVHKTPWLDNIVADAVVSACLSDRTIARGTGVTGFDPASLGVPHTLLISSDRLICLAAPNSGRLLRPL